MTDAQVWRETAERIDDGEPSDLFYALIEATGHDGKAGQYCRLADLARSAGYEWPGYKQERVLFCLLMSAAVVPPPRTGRADAEEGKA